MLNWSESKWGWTCPQPSSRHHVEVNNTQLLTGSLDSDLLIESVSSVTDGAKNVDKKWISEVNKERGVQFDIFILLK